MAWWVYGSTFNTDGKFLNDNNLGNVLDVVTGAAMAGSIHRILLSNGDAVYVDHGIIGASVLAGADGINSTGGNHIIRINGGVGALLGDVIDISGTQNNNQIMIGEFAELVTYGGTGDAIRITGNTTADIFNDVVNDGHISSYGGRGIFTTVGDLSVVNTGEIIAGTDGISMSWGSVVNGAGGLIAGGDGYGVRFTGATGTESSVINNGTIGGGFGGILGGSGNETVVNSGQILGFVSLGLGTDSYDGTGGTVAGSIFLGGGDDTGIGGDVRDILSGGVGNDTIDGGGGDDTFLITQAYSGSDGNDILDGEGGRDSYNASAATSAVIINLAEGYATGSSIGSDTLVGFERAVGGSAADTITGDDFDNTLHGGGGNDALVGGAGSDRLDGGTGVDRLTGGAGRDVLTGGDGADVFDFNTASDSGTTNATRDRITDFVHGVDDIDLSDLATAAFNFLAGGAFTGAGPEVRFQASGADTLVQISTDTDTAVEMTILLQGTIALDVGDFIV